MFLFGKKGKDKNSSDFVFSTLQNQNIYCELEWNKENPKSIILFGYNKFHDLDKILCSQNVFNREFYHSVNPRANLYIPRILYEIDWNFIFKDGLKLKSFNIYFLNYMNSTREYSLILEAVNEKNKKIIDTFSSTIKVFIDPYELTDNISKFLKYSESYK